MKKGVIVLLSAVLLSGCKSSTAEESTTTAAKTEITSPSITAPDTMPPKEEWTTAESTYSSTTVNEENPDEESYDNPIAAMAESLIGIPYVFGGSDLNGFDNSGFIYYVLRENGYISCPRLIFEQVEWAHETGYSEIRSGDILYFSSEPGGIAEYGGIYVGGGYMIYSPSPGKNVMKTDISGEYWRERFVTALSL